MVGYGFIVLNSIHAGEFFMLLLSSADFCQNYFFQNSLSGTLSECQTVWIQIRTDFLCGSKLFAKVISR